MYRIVSGAAFALITIAVLTIQLSQSAVLDPQTLDLVNKKLDSSLNILNRQVQTIWDTWDIGNYPNFLKSAGISHTSWEVMKLKYQHKILGGILNVGSEEERSFVISFMGSSVTAGHDSPVNNSFVHLTQVLMAPAFADLGIVLEARNSAMGNNPCEPYDLCPMTFSGEDADVVHWEQSYNCFGKDSKKQSMFEQFIRQCTHMPRRPIVVFSESATPNWHEKDCPTTKPKRRTSRLLRGDHREGVEALSLKNTQLFAHHSIEPILHSEASDNHFEDRPDFAEGWDTASVVATPTFTHPKHSNASKHNHSRKLAHELTSEESALLEYAKKGDFLKITADINAPTIPAEWGPQVKTFHAYQTVVGIQVWSHRHYEAYKCQGPYIPEWGCCSASWHPSLKGHELRAAHHAFFWLHILKDAIKGIKDHMKAGKAIQTLYKEIELHIRKEAKHAPTAAMYPSDYYSDNMRCITTFEPRPWAPGDLRQYIVASGDGKPAWTEHIFEELTDPKIIAKAKQTGYTDFKKILHGNVQNTALSIKITITGPEKGTFWLCEPPGNWGKLPRGYTTLWDGKTEVYITLNVNQTALLTNTFVFDSTQATALTYFNRNPKDSQVVCVDFHPYKVPLGSHVVTIVPKSSEQIMISTLVLPN